MKYILKVATVFFMLAGFPAWADHGGSHDHSGQAAEDTSEIQAGVGDAKCENVVNIKVSGLVCDFCARATEKVFSRREEVSGIRVDLDSGSVSIALKPGQTLDDATITKLITDSGYNVTDIGRGC